MKNAVSARWEVMSGLLLAVALWLSGTGVSLAQSGPAAAPAAAATGTGAMSAEKQAKLDQARTQGAAAYGSGDFAGATKWYGEAQKLDPANAELAQALERAQQMQAMRQKKEAELPTDPKAREQFLATSFDQAMQFYKDKQYNDAYKAFFTLWVSAGDYNGKVMKMYHRAGQELTKAGQTPADLTLPGAPKVDLAAVAAPAEPVAVVHKAENGEAPAVLAVNDAAAAAPAGADADKLRSMLNEAEALSKDGHYAEAIARYQEIIKLDPSNRAALTGLETAQQKETKTVTAGSTEDRLALRHELDLLNKDALKLYQSGDLAAARARWQQVLDKDPGNKLAQTYLEETREAFEKMQSENKAKAQAQKLSEEAEKLLNSPISISTAQRIRLDEFMKSLSFATPTQLEYYITGGADAMVFADFQDKSLREVLDTILTPIGLTWSINEKNVITVQPNFVSRTFPLTTSQVSRVRALIDTGELQKMIWGQTDAPAQGVSMTVDERQNVLLATGSNLHIERLESFLPTLKQVNEQDLIFRMYKIHKEDAPKIQALINSVIQASPDTPFDLERKVITSGDELIIRDTPENITKIEELLLDKQFIQKMRDEKLTIQNFSLVPRDIENQTTDQVQAFTAKVVEAIRVFLYSQEGEKQASEQGRRYWYDPATYSLTVVDTPSNISRVSEYINSLPQLGQKQRQETIFLKFAVAEDLSSSLDRILGLTSGLAGAGGAQGGNTVTWQMRRGESKTFGELRVRVLRVEENDEDDRKDDSVELQLSTGINTSSVTLTEFESQNVEDYEITAEDVLASAGQPGEGRARISIRRIPGGAGGTESALLDPQLRQQLLASTEPEEEKGIKIDAFGEMNAIILRYTDPALYQDAIDLVGQLDQPTRQVQIETKFVEVNETRAKEFSADFNIAGLGSGQDIDWSDNTINSRFAQDQDEFRDSYGPPVENAANANLIKGTTVLSAVFGSYPQLSLNLRMLEAEGIINIVNGPQVTSIDGQEAEFRIEGYVPDESDNTTENDVMDVFNPLFDTYEDVELEDVDSATNDNVINAVVLRVTPEITSDDSILLNDLSAEIIDFEGYVGDVTTSVINDTTTDEDVTSQLLTTSQASTNLGGKMWLKRKKIITNARVSNGGTIVLGGWTGERTEDFTSGVPVLRNMPYLGKLLFSRAQRSSNRTTLMIFLTCSLIK